MAAYAALNSVMYILQQIQHHPRPPITLKKQHMCSLCEIISFLQDFLEKYSHRDIGDGKEALESRIADAAYAAEDIIESHIVDQILAKSNNFINLFYRDVKKMIRILADSTSNGLFCRDLHKVIEDMNLIKKEVIKIQEKIRGINDDQLPTNIISMSAKIIGSSTVPPPTRKHYTNIMVGFDDVLIRIMDRLTGYPTNRQVLPIVGMGGIGKTTLARNVYDNPTIAQHFHIRIWVTISQDYRLRNILLEALSYRQNDESTTSEDALGHQLYKSLCGRKYLIVLDDMWSVEAWEKLMLFFPDNNNGSRIIVTTRLSNVADHFRSHSIMLNFLDEEKSWDLFCKIVFPQDPCCPPELEWIGKKIARNCKGLPLSISVIGGLLLANSEKTRQHWQYIAERINRIVNLEDDMHCLKILYLSYNDLPIHLKPCFLYMGVFREDTQIAVSSLIRLWDAEGFLKPIAAKSLEVVAEEYLKDLIHRNLILVSKWGSSTGKVKYCKIHDLLRDLCIREAKKDRFLWVSELQDKFHWDSDDFENLKGIQSQRRISVHKGESTEGYHYDIARVVEAVASASLARSLICDLKDVCLLSRRFRLVRVFKTVGKNNYYSLNDIFEFVNSRYLDFKPEYQRSTSIHLPWNLHTLIIQGDQSSYIPPEIWKISQLRHLDIGRLFLPDPPKVPLFHRGDDFILRNLQTLKGVVDLKLSEKAIKRIPNIKKLQLEFPGSRRWDNCCLNKFCLLNKLESLCILSEWRRCDYYPPNFAFPQALKKLTFYETEFLWEDMRMIGSLPNLQVLKLKNGSFRGPEWNPAEREFICLKFLLIEYCNDLVYWNADRTHFPCLEHLVLRRLHNLKEIPLDIGQIPTLLSIELSNCSHSADKSAKNLLGEQVEHGNEDLQVRVDGKSQFSSWSL